MPNYTDSLLSQLTLTLSSMGLPVVVIAGSLAKCKQSNLISDFFLPSLFHLLKKMYLDSTMRWHILSLFTKLDFSRDGEFFSDLKILKKEWCLKKVEYG